jgi:hypothetical protein
MEREKTGRKRRRAPRGPAWFMKGKGGERVSYYFGASHKAEAGKTISQEEGWGWNRVQWNC